MVKPRTPKTPAETLRDTLTQGASPIAALDVERVERLILAMENLAELPIILAEIRVQVQRIADKPPNGNPPPPAPGGGK